MITSINYLYLILISRFVSLSYINYESYKILQDKTKQKK